MSKEENKYLATIGLTFPTCEEELVAYERLHQETNYELEENALDPLKIAADLEKENVPKQKATNVDYHKRTVLAAEIVFQSEDDNSLGHLKLQKLMFLCQHHSRMQLQTNFLKQAMGPYDPRLMRSIDKQFVSRKWFEFQPNEFPKYKRLEKCGEHQYWFDIYFSDQKKEIDYIIETFKGFKTNQIELVGTIFACWQKGIENKTIISDQLLINEVYRWHETKKDKFSEELIISAIRWMEENGVYPS